MATQVGKVETVAVFLEVVRNLFYERSCILSQHFCFHNRNWPLSGIGKRTRAAEQNPKFSLSNMQGESVWNRGVNHCEIRTWYIRRVNQNLVHICRVSKNLVHICRVSKNLVHICRVNQNLVLTLMTSLETSGVVRDARRLIRSRH